MRQNHQKHEGAQSNHFDPDEIEVIRPPEHRSADTLNQRRPIADELFQFCVALIHQVVADVSFSFA